MASPVHADGARAVVVGDIEMTPDLATSDEDAIGDSSDEDEANWRPPWGPVSIVLAVELCERLTYYTLAGSQKTYLNKQLGYSPASAASMNSVFSMLCYMWCLPGGLMADVIGRYKVIVALASTYAAGTLVVAIATASGVQQGLRGLFLIGAMGLIPFGTGGIKPNICNFGADQIGDDSEVKREAQKRFFSYFYLSINVGVLIAFGYLSNVTTHGIPGLVPLKEGYFAAYLVAAASMALAVLVFFCGTKCFMLLPGGGIEGFKTMTASLVYSLRTGCTWNAVLSATGWITMPIFFICTIAAALWPTDDEEVAAASASSFPNQYEEACDAMQPAPERLLFAFGGAEELPMSFASCKMRRLHGGSSGGPSGGVKGIITNLALILGIISCTCLVAAHRSNHWIKPLPKKQATAFSVEEVRAGFATIPLIIVVNLSYSMAYNAMNNAMPSQACQMNTYLFGSQLNGAFFNLGDAIAIIIFTPLFESLLVPFIGRLKGSPIRLGQKIITGLLIAALANLVSAYLEVKRRHSQLMCDLPVSECAPNGIHMRDISAFWMFIPFALIGASEVLVNPCMYYFAYTAAPPKVRSLVQAFNLFFQGSVSNAFTSVITDYTFPNDLDTGHLEYYYFANVICAFVGVLFYFYLTRCGRNAEDLPAEIRDEDMDATEHIQSRPSPAPPGHWEASPDQRPGHRHRELAEESASSEADD